LDGERFKNSVDFLLSRFSRSHISFLYWLLRPWGLDNVALMMHVLYSVNPAMHCRGKAANGRRTRALANAGLDSDTGTESESASDAMEMDEIEDAEAAEPAHGRQRREESKRKRTKGSSRPPVAIPEGLEDAADENDEDAVVVGKNSRKRGTGQAGRAKATRAGGGARRH
jgi:hypothetical protein